MSPQGALKCPTFIQLRVNNFDSVNNTYSTKSHQGSRFMLRRHKSPLASNHVYKHFEENIKSDFDNMLSVKMKSFYKKTGDQTKFGRSRSVQKPHPHVDIHSSYISYSHKPARIMFKFNKPVHLDQLPKLKYKQSKADKLEQSQTKETLEDTYQKDDTSTIDLDLTQPIVLKSDLPDPNEIIK